MTVVLLVIFTALNFLAMKTFSKVNSGITWWKVAIPVITIIILLFKFHGGNFSSHGFNSYGWKALFAAIPSAGIVFAYLGFEQADQLAAEIKNPQKNLPRAILLATFIGIIIYCMLQVAFIGAMPSSQIAHGWAKISDPNILAGPFAGLAGIVGLSALAVVLRIDAFVSPFGTGLMYQTSSSRVGYGLGRNRYFPQVMTRVNKNGIPWVGLIVAFVAGLFFLLPFPSWHSLVSLVTGASVLMYAGAPLAMGAFRRQVPEADRPYRVPAGGVIAPLAFIIANMLIYWSGFETVWKLGLVIVIGYVLIAICMAFDENRPPLDWKSAQWLPFYLIGIGIISWQGQYSGGAVAAPLNTNHIPFWWDMLVVAAFSLVIYYWAMATRLPKAEMLNLVERQSGIEPPERRGLTEVASRAQYRRPRPARPGVFRCIRRASGSGPGPAVAEQDPALDQPIRNHAERPAVRRTGRPVVRAQPPPAGLAAGGPLHQQQFRLGRVPGDDQLPGTDPDRVPGPGAPPDEQPVTRVEGGFHGPLHDRNAP